jgi:hypothetical protein
MNNTVTMSPKARLRVWLEERGYTASELTRGSRGLTAVEVLGYRFKCGDIVREKGGRHEARLDAVLWATTASVTWLESGWKSELLLSEIEAVA